MVNIGRTLEELTIKSDQIEKLSESNDSIEEANNSNTEEPEEIKEENQSDLNEDHKA